MKRIIESLELHAAFHCNINCKGCMHFSPIEQEKFININKTVNTLKSLERIISIKTLRILGGEPLLNKNLKELIIEVKKTGIAQNISLSTNGILLSKHYGIWEYLDEIEISNYNYSNEYMLRLNDILKKISEKYNLKITVYNFKYFREPYSEIINLDKHLVKNIYQNCLFSKSWQCFNLINDCFYKCPQSYFIDKYICSNQKTASGIKITGTDIKSRLYDYLDSEKPLNACSYCLGSVGKKFSIQQVPKNSWRKEQEYTVDKLLDYKLLDRVVNNSIKDYSIGTVESIYIYQNGYKKLIKDYE